MFSIIGIGQCGNSIADLAAKMEYPTIAVNYSQKDLDSCHNVSNKIQLIGSEGVGKDRTRAMELMQDNWEIVTHYVKQKFSHPSIEVIFVVFSTGGGSGSGISPVVIEMLSSEMPEKVFVACPIIPDKSESFTNQLNCLETFQELSELESAIFPIDNEKARSAHSSKNRLYTAINGTFLNQLNQLLHYTEQQSPYSNLDKTDLLTIFRTKGIGLISELALNIEETQHKSNDSEWLSNAISHSWKHGIFADNSMNKIEKAGIIVDGDERVIESLNIHQVFKSVKSGSPLSLFEGYYSTSQNKVITILTGLSWCNERLQQIDQLLEENNENINSILSEEEVYKPKHMNMRFKSPSRTPVEKKQRKSSLDILKKYNRK